MLDQTVDDPLNYQVIFLKNKEQDEVYAKYKTFGEYYPETGQFARDRNGKPRYAVTENRLLQYPRDKNGSEYFLKDGNDDYIYDIQGLKYPVRFINDSDNNTLVEEIYPIREQTHEGRVERIEYPIPNRHYALGSDGHPYYPLGFSGNEYYFLGIRHPYGYPISHDGFYLAPFVESKVEEIITIPSDITIERKNILKKVPVYKGHNDTLVYHYLTDIKANRKPRSITTPVVTTRSNFQILFSKLFSMFHLCFLLICLIISIVIMWYWKKNT